MSAVWDAALPLTPSGSIMKVMSFGETIFLFVLALLVFGPKKLPEIARQLGKIMNEFRKASNEFRSQIESEISNIDAEHNRRQVLPPSEAPGGAIATLESRPSLAGVTEPRSSDIVVPETHVSETQVSETRVLETQIPETQASDTHVSEHQVSEHHLSEPHVADERASQSTQELASKAALPDA
jgi:sec-independent protein translocase protein TatB